MQTLENNPAIIHGGPFANIAHGCNSVIATKAGLKMADYVVTEAGFGADLGAEKFFDIKCRAAGLHPDAAVIVATTRALKMHGGVSKEDLDKEDLAALEDGCCNLVRHIENVKAFGVPVVVGINRFTSDTDAEIALIKKVALANGVKAIDCTHWADGGAGTEELAQEVVALVDRAMLTLRPCIQMKCQSGTRLKPLPLDSIEPMTLLPIKKIRDQIRTLQDVAMVISQSVLPRRSTAFQPTQLERRTH